MEASTIEAESVSLWPMYLDDLAIQLVLKWLEHIEPFLTGMSQITRFFHLEKKCLKFPEHLKIQHKLRNMF